MNEKTRILIASADVSSSKYIKMQFEMAEFNVIGTVTDGVEAISWINNDKPDVLLMDINLEGEIDGIETARAILNHIDIPIILMTDYQNMDALIRAQDLKLAWHFVKPFDIGKVQQVIDSILEVCS